MPGSDPGNKGKGKTMEKRYFVYRKKDGSKRYTFIKANFPTLETALNEAKKYLGGYVIICDYTGKEISKKIYPENK